MKESVSWHQWQLFDLISENTYCTKFHVPIIARLIIWGYSLDVRATLKHHGVYTVTQLTEGKTRVWIISLNTINGISPDRGENQREKSKVSPLPVSPCFTTLSCAWTHYLVHTDPMLRGPLTDSGCTYASHFTSAVTPEVEAEWSSDLRVEWSSDLGVGWNLEQRKCEMGHPLTLHQSDLDPLSALALSILWVVASLSVLPSQTLSTHPHSEWDGDKYENNVLAFEPHPLHRHQTSQATQFSKQCQIN